MPKENEILQFVRAKPYRFVKQIGQGGLGTTVLLSDDLIGEVYVGKKYQPFNDADRDAYFDNFVQEVKLLHRMFHKNVVRVFNHYLYPQQKTGVILMEYVDGNEIDVFLRKTPEMIDETFIQTIDGFRYLEEIEILHRDIRPQNILVSIDAIVKIIDFGFGKQIEFGEHFDKSISLNWRYLPPKEFQQQRYDFKTEVYFVGKLFEEIISENGIENFKFFEILREMTNPNPDSRIGSFFDVSRRITGEVFPDLPFTEEEIEIYQDFANFLSRLFLNQAADTEYVRNPDLVISKLEEIYKSSMLESEVQYSLRIADCFMKGSFRYRPREQCKVSTLNGFLRFLRAQPPEKKNIIMSNIWSRLDAIPIYDPPAHTDDDIPF